MGNQDIVARVATTDVDSSLDAPTAIQRYLNGESMQVIAKAWGITPQGAFKRCKRFMLSYTGSDEAYHNLITQALVDRVAEADERLETAPDAVDIARAREMARFARMDLERRRPKLYGPKQEMSVDNTVTIIVNRNTSTTPQYVDVTPETTVERSVHNAEFEEK